MMTLQLKTNEELAVHSALVNYKKMLADINQNITTKGMAEMYEEEIESILELLQERVEVVNDILNKLEGEVYVNQEADTDL